MNGSRGNEIPSIYGISHLNTRMESFPDIPSYQPPLVPDYRIGEDTGGIDTTEMTQKGVRNRADYDEQTIPDQILYELAKKQYRSCISRLQEHDRKFSIMSFLELAEQCFEEASQNLKLFLYQKAAHNYIKGYTIFKIAAKLNRDPSKEDIIGGLRHFYHSTDFTKLTDIVDDTFIMEEERRNNLGTKNASSSSITLVEKQSHGVLKPSVSVSSGQQLFSHIVTPSPVIQPYQNSTPRTLDPLKINGHKYTELINPNFNPSNDYYLYDHAPPKNAPPNIQAPKIPTQHEYYERPPSPPPFHRTRELEHSRQIHPRPPAQQEVYSRPPVPPPMPPPMSSSYYIQAPYPQMHTNGGPRGGENSICGLQNFGNSCYLNSILQCLFNIGPFSLFFKSNNYVQYVHEVKGRNSNICLSYALGSLFRVMDKHSGSTIAPTRFFSFLIKISDFQRSEQQDAQEALLIILNRLHDELCNNELAALNFPLILERHSDDPDYEKWFNGKLKLEKLSPVNGFFEGQQETVITCQNCGFISRSFSSFNVLTLNVRPNDSRGVVSIEELLDFYTDTERLQGQQSWDCPECKKSRENEIAQRKYLLEERQRREREMLFAREDSPELRDQSPSKEKEKLSKKLFKKRSKKLFNSEDPQKLMNDAHLKEKQRIDTEVEQIAANMVSTKFTMFLSLPSYLVIHIPRSVKGSTRLSTNIKYPLILEINLESGQRVRFKLQSTINHSGSSANSGHYTALCNKGEHISNPRWCHFNDELFTLDLSHGDLLRGIRRLTSHDVYLLFYERIES